MLTNSAFAPIKSNSANTDTSVPKEKKSAAIAQPSIEKPLPIGINEFSYARSGVGTQQNCPLQLIWSGESTTSNTLETLKSLGPYGPNQRFNCIRISLDNCGSVSAAIELLNVSKQIGWSAVMSCDISAPETLDSFIADLSVGLGISQFMGGGLTQIEYAEKYNRLLEIHRSNDSIPYWGSKFRA